MNGFEKRASLIKEKIKKTTLELLKTWEPGRIRVADIAKAAKVSQVTIYNYYGSKEGLLHEVLKEYVEGSLREFEECLNNDALTFRDKLQYLLLMEKESYKTIPLHMIKELLIDDQEMFHYIEEEYTKRAVPLMMRLIEDGKRTGEVSDKVSSEAVLLYIQMFFDQSQKLMEMVQQMGNVEKLFEELVHVFFYGICGQELSENGSTPLE